MKELSLFSGAGGGLLGSKLLGWETVGYVENEPYCQKVLRQRIADGILDAAPIFGDIRKFISEGWADRYCGKVDIITAGFPCQPFSVAGKLGGANDRRNMWPETVECIHKIRPRFAFLENVPGLLAHEYFGTILGDLAESGYFARWDCIWACDVGANIPRGRWFLVAVTSKNGFQRELREDIKVKDITSKAFLTGKIRSHNKDEIMQTEPKVIGSLNDVADAVDRTMSIGNGQVPLCMAYAFSILSKGIIE